MSKIWVPTGNDAQTEIDIQLAKLKYYKKRTQQSLYYVTVELDSVEHSLKEIMLNLTSLKGTRNIVSMREFSMLKFKYAELLHFKSETKKTMSLLTEEVDDWDCKINTLIAERMKLSTKILRFNLGKRKR